MTTVVEHCGDAVAAAIREAVDRLMQSDPKALGFVLVELEWSDGYVQFAGSRAEELRIDCPPLGFIGIRWPIEEAPGSALKALYEQGLRPGEKVRIVEGEQRHIALSTWVCGVCSAANPKALEFCYCCNLGERSVSYKNLAN